MSFVRPELAAEFHRLREVIGGLTLAAIGVWLALQGGIVLVVIGLALLALGLALGVSAWRRLRFRQDGDAPGLVQVLEGQIAFLGPRSGGFIGLPDLVEIRLLTLRGRRVWHLQPLQGQALHIPVEAAGADALFDAFATLPGLDTATLVAALSSQIPSESKVVALNAVSRVVWTRPGAGIVSR